MEVTMVRKIQKMTAEIIAETLLWLELFNKKDHHPLMHQVKDLALLFKR